MDITRYRNIIDEAFEGQEEAMLTLLERLVSIDSPATFPEGVDEVGRTCATFLEQAGFEARRLSKPPVPEDEAWQADLGQAWTARTGDIAEGPGIAFIGHMDTVFPAGTAKARPFRVDRAADKLYGPGVGDMKGGLVAMMFAAKVLKEHDLLPCPLTLMFSCDEELGSPTSSKGLRTCLAGARAVFCAEPGGVGGFVTLSRKGSGHMHLRVKGISAHAGRNYEDGASAILALSQKVLAYNELLDLAHGVTINTGLISGGNSANSIAPWAEARIHLTYRRLEDGERLVADIRRITEETSIAGTSAAISGGIRLYPLERTESGDKLYGLVLQAGKMLGIELKGQHYESAAESGFCSSVLGVPTICCMGPEADLIHTDKEFMVLSTLVKRAKLLALSAILAAEEFR